jgi:ketosteroid isomerase-like protein
VHVVRLLDVAPGFALGRVDLRGRATDGGEIEVPYLLLGSVRDGLLDRTELFDPGDEDRARRRFEELSRADTPAGVRELIDRFVAAYNARDWDGLRALYAPDLRFEDHRLMGWGALEGIEPLIQRAKGGVELAPDVRMEVEVLALGSRALVARMLSRGHLEAGGGEVEVEIVSFSLVEHGRATHLEFFDGTDVGAALARFEDLGARIEPERLYARVSRLLLARDWGALGDCFAEDFESVEHRALGWEPIRGREGVVELYRSWVGVAPDAETRFEALAGDAKHLVVRVGGHGHAAEGGGLMEYVITVVSTIRDGRIARSEYFDPGEESAALARLEELRAP